MFSVESGAAFLSHTAVELVFIVFVGVVAMDAGPPPQFKCVAIHDDKMSNIVELPGGTGVVCYPRQRRHGDLDKPLRLLQRWVRLFSTITLRSVFGSAASRLISALVRYSRVGRSPRCTAT